MVDPDDPDDVARALAVDEEQVQFALELGGTCTGEHGVGLGKQRYLTPQFGAEAVAVMRTVKDALDPRGIMNPGKLLPDA
jgi:D-lactate dehydrogenase (cytochrome)